MGGEKARYSTDGARTRQGRGPARWLASLLLLGGVAPTRIPGRRSSSSCSTRRARTASVRGDVPMPARPCSTSRAPRCGLPPPPRELARDARVDAAADDRPLLPPERARPVQDARASPRVRLQPARPDGRAAARHPACERLGHGRRQRPHLGRGGIGAGATVRHARAGAVRQRRRAWGRPKLVDRAVALWEARVPTRPLFLYLHLMDMHLPRPLPAGVPAPQRTTRRRFNAGGEPVFDRERRRWTLSDAADFTLEDRAHFAWMYEERVRYADRQLGRLLAAIDRSDPGLRHTLVVVTADHGEELAEDGRIDHTQSLADAVQHVPWIVAGGPVRSGQRAARVTEHVDVLPTLSSHCSHCRPPPGVRFDGRAADDPDGRVCPRRCGRSRRALCVGGVSRRPARTLTRSSSIRRRASRRAAAAAAASSGSTGSDNAPSQGWARIGGSRDSRARPRRSSTRRERPLPRRSLRRRRTVPFLVRTDFWHLDPPSAIRCVTARRETPKSHAPRARVVRDRPRARVDRPRSTRPVDRATSTVTHQGYAAVDAAADTRSRRRRSSGGVSRWRRRGIPVREPWSTVSLGTQRRARPARCAYELPPRRPRSGRHVLGLRLSRHPVRTTTTPATLDPERSLERLRKLGYVQSADQTRS